MTAIIHIILVLLVLYLFFIAPRLFHKPDRSHLMGVLYAHRGLHDNKTNAPENSIAAFKKAVNAGYGIELDVRLTKDNIPVVFHDANLKRMCGDERKVCDLTFEELQQFTLLETGEKIPKFEDVLNTVGGKVPLIIEWKLETSDPAVCAVSLPLLEKYEGPYCIESFNPAALIWYRKHQPQVVRGQLSMEFSKAKAKTSFGQILVQHLITNAAARPDFIAYDHNGAGNLSRRLATKFFGALSVAWTVRSQDEYEAAKDNFTLFIFDSFIPQ